MVPGSIRDFLLRCLQTATTHAFQLTTPVRKHTHTVGSQFRQVCSQSFKKAKNKKQKLKCCNLIVWFVMLG